MEKTPKQAYDDLVDWLSQFDVNQPLFAYIQDPALLEPPQIEPEALQELEAQAQAYLQELFEQGLIPDAPPMERDPKLLEPTKEMDQDFDFGR